MKRIRTEILHFRQGQKHDKVYIVEVLANDEQFFVYANYGKRTQEHLIRQLKYTTEYWYVAIDEFNNLAKKKIKEGYKLVENNSVIDIPGLKHILNAAKVKLDLNKKINQLEEKLGNEHRKLLL
jgi:hypothetical protein